MTIFFLSKKGYGSIDEIEDWDTTRFLDAVEYERIIHNIEKHKYAVERDKVK